MARIAVPNNVVQQAPSQPIVQAKNAPGFNVILQNVGPVDVYVGDNQTQLDAVDQTTGAPTAGFILQPNTPPVTLFRVTTGLWVRSIGIGGQIEVNISVNCD